MNSKDEGVGVWGCGGVYVCVNGILLSHQKERNFAICQMASLVAQMVKNLPATQETWVRSLGWEDSPGERHGNPLQYSGLENHHEPRSLAGYSPWDHKESATTERLSTVRSSGYQTRTLV